MPANTAMFLFLAAGAVGLFAFLSIAVWVAGPAQERQARDRMDLLKSLAGQPPESATPVLEYLREQDRKREARRREEERRGYLLGGTITSTLGVGIAVSLYITRPDSSWTVGVLAVLVGAVLIGTGLAIRRTSDPERQRDIR